MKPPFEFGSKLIMRLLLPGGLLGASSLPLALAARDAAGLQLDDRTTFAIAALALGWLILLCDMPIYMLFEGRRYWPARLHAWGLERERKRLAELGRRADDENAGERQRLEFQIDRQDCFPITPSGGYAVPYPSRLGNILACFEEYPDRKYGMDGVFFWHRIWVAIDKDLREEMDGAQAIVDGALYLAFAFLVSAMLCLLYAIVAATRPELLPAVRLGWAALLACALACLVLSRLVYLASLHGQRQYGQLFRALFDQHRDKVMLDPLAGDLIHHLALPRFPAMRERRKTGLVWRFLRWHRYKPPGARSDLVGGWED